MKSLIFETEKYVSELLQNNLPQTFLYHSFSHTKNVVNSVIEICEGEQLNETDTQLITLAAWLHDIGYIKDKLNHEEASVSLAKKHLKDSLLTAAQISIILQLIIATKMGHEPQNNLEKIIRDADCAHFGSKDFFDQSDLLRAEWELTLNKNLSDIEWTQENIDFSTQQHQFYTNYAIENWQKRKHKNLIKLTKDLKKLKADAQKTALKKAELSFKQNKAILPERGIETMFRVTLRNHISLSDIADTKANILLSVNAIIVSLVLANLLPKLDNPSNTYLIYPTVIFVIFTIITMILSVLATRPNVTSGQFNKEDVKNKKVNLLFFGNFHKMKLDEFEWAMNELMHDKDYLYGSMTKDLYFLGKVLDRKYKILRITYTFFIIGIVISASAFSIAFHYYA
ncbi:Pycsar system effector family protein [Aquimarina agarilytica]|uniref:Pycsar system effector family protein n=1 Tax=Aquimarina agarilytica TaxID=1087449 RepID=UPI000287C28F|nr:Pycsar system effector family protein [Aquimarina agarilytica]